MRIYKTESDRLKKVTSLIHKKFPSLGINKKQEITRLLYEISKKEALTPGDLVHLLDASNFSALKNSLLKRRFPYAYKHEKIESTYLPKIGFNPKSIPDLKKPFRSPKKIYIEKRAKDSFIARNFISSFPDARVSEIDSLKNYLKTNRSYNTEDYLKRHETFFITYENYDFFKQCPCTKKAIGCGYHIFNLSFGCIFDCTYCYLQEYANVPGIIFPANLDKFFKEFSSYKRPGMRIGTGEFSDSLMLDDVTKYSLSLLDFFKGHKDVTFEFKTKSVNIANLLKTPHSGNIVLAWSLNPQKIISDNEYFTPLLMERIKAARSAVLAGYKVAFHFDPIIYFKGWKKEYEKVIDLVFTSVKPKDIAWISLGTLRFNPKLKKVIEERFPGNKILDEELLPGFDQKLRYPYTLRQNIYSSILKTLSKHSKTVPIYLCMEESSMWKNLNKQVCHI